MHIYISLRLFLPGKIASPCMRAISISVSSSSAHTSEMTMPTKAAMPTPAAAMGVKDMPKKTSGTTKIKREMPKSTP